MVKCRTWARENNVEVVDAACMQIINDKWAEEEIINKTPMQKLKFV